MEALGDGSASFTQAPGASSKEALGVSALPLRKRLVPGLSGIDRQPASAVPVVTGSGFPRSPPAGFGFT